MRKEKDGQIKHLIFNPITAERNLYTYNQLGEIMGCSHGHLCKSKIRGHKLSKINCYILDADTSPFRLKELMEKEVLKDEIWKQYENLCYVSSYGRVKTLQGKFLLPLENTRAISVRVCSNYKYTCILLKRAIYETFIGDIEADKCIVSANGFKWDCNASNLIQVDKTTLLQMTRHKRYEGLVAIDIKTLEHEEFTTYADFRRAWGNDGTGMIGKLIREHKAYKDFVLVSDKEFNEDYIEEYIERCSNIIIAIDEQGNKKYYMSFRDAGRNTFLCRDTIAKYTNTGIFYGGYKFYKGVQHGR